MACTALRTPLPPYRALSPSRFSTASCAPVDAPDGTIASSTAPKLVATDTATVGLPRESSTSRARTLSMNGRPLPRSASSDIALVAHEHRRERMFPRVEFLVGEPDRDLAGGALRRIAAVHEVTSDRL